MENQKEFSNGFIEMVVQKIGIQKEEIPQYVLDILNKPLPAEAIKKHPAKTFLSTIKPIYVIDRLNEAFGVGGWFADYQIIDNSKADIIVKGYLFVPKYSISLTNFGGNDNGGSASKNFDQGDAYKGACTDALTKMASYLGIGAHVWRNEKVTAQRPAPSYKVNKKPLGEKGFNAVINRFNKGEIDIVGKVEKQFALTALQKQKLKMVVNDYRARVKQNGGEKEVA